MNLTPFESGLVARSGRHPAARKALRWARRSEYIEFASVTTPGRRLPRMLSGYVSQDGRRYHFQTGSEAGRPLQDAASRKFRLGGGTLAGCGMDGALRRPHRRAQRQAVHRVDQRSGAAD